MAEQATSAPGRRMGGDGQPALAGSVDNALRLLTMFRRTRLVRVTDVAAELGVARSTAHRLLQVLTAHGYVVQDQATKAYQPGPALIGLAVSLVDDLDLRTVAAPIMADLVDELGETVHLSVLQGSGILFIHSVESAKTLRVGIRTGGSLPAHSTAAGRVMLAHLPDDDPLRALPGGGLSALTSRTVTDASRIDDLLAVARANGYAVSAGETEEDVASVAVPVLDAIGRPIAALAVSAPPARLTAEALDVSVRLLANAARRISDQLPAGH